MLAGNTLNPVKFQTHQLNNKINFIVEVSIGDIKYVAKS